MTLSPMMKQYHDAKAASGDALLFFRMGDFYELFGDDATVAAKKLGLTLTSRDKGKGGLPMAGFPHHQLDGYLAKLIQMGHRVAVCDQVEDAKAAKGLVKREITRIVSPGTVTDDTLLDPQNASYLAAIATEAPAAKNRRKRQADQAANRFGIAWIELSSGDFFATTCNERTALDLLARIAPRELLVVESLPGEPTRRSDEKSESSHSPYRRLVQQLQVAISPSPTMAQRPAWSFGYDKAVSNLCNQFKTANLDGMGFGAAERAAVQAAGAVLEYLRETQKSGLGHVRTLRLYRQADFLEIDGATWRSLEIAQTLRSGAREGSLLGAIDMTVTSMGSRMLGRWIAAPLVDESAISERLDAVDEFVSTERLRREIRQFLGGTYDIQRLLAKISAGRANPRDIQFIGSTLGQLPGLKAKLAGRRSKTIGRLHEEIRLCDDLLKEITSSLADDVPAHTRDGGFIREGYNEELDALRELASGGKSWIANYQAEISQASDIPSLKVGYNKVFGYYLEVTHAHRDKVPESFIRKQTLKNAERYITPELKEYEEKILSADERAQTLEMELFERLRERLKQFIQPLRQNAEVIATLDALSGLAELAHRHNYCRPTVTTKTQTRIVDGRHPVIDIVEDLGTFVPNSTEMSENHDRIHLITGPNMAGKSTYIRQVALISMMAQIGSFVPASEATIGIADKIFARVGASDELSRGYSTFMVEMSETARILNTATSRSLIILDEIGRGTSTYDGVSLAWAIVEYLHDHIGARTLFATHYHELTELEKSLQQVRNYNVTVKEWQDQIVFLHKIVPGAADKSYGIHVARLAGVPAWVNSRAEAILDKLESNPDGNRQDAVAASVASAEQGVQLTLFEMVEHPLIDKIKQIDPNHVTPIDALQMIGQWKQELEP